MDIRPSPISGSWYPSKPDALQALVKRFLITKNSNNLRGKILGIVSPHAGFAYSGAVAGKGYAHLQSTPPTFVVILSPFHDSHAAPFLTSSHDSYQTPLGIIHLDQASLQSLDAQLLKKTGLGLTKIRKDREHAIEIQLPFLQTIWNDFKLLPIMLRTRDRVLLNKLGEILAEIYKDAQVLYIASSDLSHFYSRNTAEKLDREILKRVCSLDPTAVLEAEEQGIGYACGAAAISVMLWAVRCSGADHGHVAAYQTSGDMDGNYNRVVGYGSVLVSKEPRDAPN